MRFVYFAILIGLCFFYALYSDNLSLIVLIMAVLIPIALFVLLKYSVSKLKISAAASDSKVKKNGFAEIAVRIENRSVFPVSALSLSVTSVRYPTGEQESQSVSVPVPAMSCQQVSIKISSEYCQRVCCTVSGIKAFDLLRLFSAKVKKCGVISAYVDFLPSGAKPLSEKYVTMFSAVQPVSSEKTAAKSNTSQDFDELREYRDGDKLNRIAWKLSGRSEELIVRDSSKGGRSDILLIADTTSAGNDIRMSDSIFETFYSAATKLCEQEIPFDAYTSSGEFIADISLSDRFESCIGGIYGSVISAERAAENKENRRYDIIYVVAAAGSDSCADALRKGFGARNVIFITPSE